MQPRDKIIPWYFVMFFLFIAAVDAVLVTLAVSTQTGVVTEHPYEKGLAYNKVVEAQEKQRELGWSSEILYNAGRLHFVLKDDKGEKIAPQKITVSIVRPTQAGMDFKVEMTGDVADVTFPQKGLWEVRVDAVYNDIHYQQTKRIVVE